ncbi:hypothetical protein [Hymenobacter jeollabukensis]|uniref:DUF5004 domain-containing protein n=1 Tax=Hymenobacter jeollabukensis TaxID=2025313 RepID=A0A5R8WNJ4_9BACT|nr:hypothetical protein [Hymenobacter jeollabukensis]TLM91206.1 hypothetical protein FDY95_16565 [Hymenobacter jeollabukensis]
MKKLTVYLSLALTLAGLASCEKEIDEVAQPAAQAAADAKTQQTPLQLLSGGQWHLTDLKTTSKAAGSTDAVTVSIFGQLKPTMRDNLTQFTADGRYIQDEGATKLNPAMAQQKAGSYKLSEDNKTLTVTLPNLERVYSVEELTATTLRLKLTEGTDDKAVSFESTFSH